MICVMRWGINNLEELERVENKEAKAKCKCITK